MFSNRDDELPPWSIKRQKAYKVSRFIWIAQAIVALLAGAGILVFMMRM